MLHGTPNCRGIAHQADSVFWVFNDYDKSLDKYDFGTPHEPGGDDHSDGSIFRYAEGKVKGAADGTPSHVFFDADDKFLYVADTGSKRILRLDTTSGKKGGPLPRANEPLKDEAVMTGATLEVIVDAGVLEKPSGLEIRKGLIYVTDAATSTFHVFDKTGTAIRSLATGLPAGSLAGFAFGPGNKVYFTDKVGGRVLRIDPQ
jgi:DNA-binding beta-propeller fold protein YncE